MKTQKKSWRSPVLALTAVAVVTMMASAAHAAATPTANETGTTEKPTGFAWVKKHFGMDLNSFFSGPGIGQPLSLSPGSNGFASDTGLSFYNLLSMKWKFSERFAFDVQLRSQLMVTNLENQALFGDILRWQGQRFGVSGKLLSGESWSLRGALNTDLPIPGLVGQINEGRKLLFNPGTFATFSYKPAGSRWSVFALLAPRFFFYSDNEAMALQDVVSGLSPGQKLQWTLYANPSINYDVTDKLGVRLGTTLEVSKQFSWSAPRRNYMPMEFGVTYDVTDSINIYPYVAGSLPGVDDSLRASQTPAGEDVRAWYNTWAMGIWVSGNLF
jgi:hypothetical protein